MGETELANPCGKCGILPLIEENCPYCLSCGQWDFPDILSEEVKGLGIQFAKNDPEQLDKNIKIWNKIQEGLKEDKPVINNDKENNVLDSCAICSEKAKWGLHSPYCGVCFQWNNKNSNSKSDGYFSYVQKGMSAKHKATIWNKRQKEILEEKSRQTEFKLELCLQCGKMPKMGKVAPECSCGQWSTKKKRLAGGAEYPDKGVKATKALKLQNIKRWNRLQEKKNTVVKTDKKEENNMTTKLTVPAKDLSSAVSSTNNVMLESVKEGMKTASALTAQRLVTSQVLALLGESVPKEFLETPFGQALVDFGSCYLVHGAVEMYPQVPGADMVKQVAALAAQGAAHEHFAPLAEMAKQLVESVASSAAGSVLPLVKG